MNRIIPASLAFLLLAGGHASGQSIFVGPGSTAEGDYFRGIGIAAWGLGQYAAGVGQYNLDTAMAERINVDSFITLSSYLDAVANSRRIHQAKLRAQEKARHLRDYAAQQIRIYNTPDERDIRNGETLNAHIRDFLSGKYTRTELEAASVPLPADLVRKLPFKLNEQGATMSMWRMLHKEFAPWPVAFQNPKCRPLCIEFHDAISEAINQQIAGEVRPEVIARCSKAVLEMRRWLDATCDRNDEKLYFPAWKHTEELSKVVEQLKSEKVERIIASLETYSGSTVYDLVELMNKHHIEFASAELPAEREAYRRVFEVLKAQRQALNELSRSSSR
jgi:hypothetical protein